MAIAKTSKAANKAFVAYVNQMNKPVILASPPPPKQSRKKESVEATVHT